jgi:hypothetical protein
MRNETGNIRLAVLINVGSLQETESTVSASMFMIDDNLL